MGRTTKQVITLSKPNTDRSSKGQMDKQKEEIDYSSFAWLCKIDLYQEDI